MTSKRSIYEIEVALARTREFDFTKNLVVFNVFGESSILWLDHECDVLVLSKAGYLTEIEIKRSWSDFLVDFKKRCFHNCCGVIKSFFYCVSELFADKVIEYLEENKVDCSGVIVYNEEGRFKFGIYYTEQASDERWSAKKLFMEQQLYLARLGCMRAISLREKMIEDLAPIKEMCNYVTPYEPKNDK